jgi:hypothetical protein
MQLTSKFILLAVALAYGGTTISAFPIEESSLAAREVDDVELFTRDFNSYGSSYGAHGNSYGVPAMSGGLGNGNSHPYNSYATKDESVKSQGTGRKGRGANYDPKPTQDVESRRQFRKIAGQDSDLLKEAAKDPGHAFHSTAIHMKKEEALRKNPRLLNKALKDESHPLYKHALTVKAQNTRRKATLRAALNDEGHPMHGVAVGLRNSRLDKTIRKAQTKNPNLVTAALANPKHPLHEAAHRVAKETDRANNEAAFGSLPFAS